MKVFAHRGFSGNYPENTMLAFRKAIEAGADGIELDIHESSDGQLVIIHDENLVRTTGIDGLVSDYTLKELTRIKASRTKDDAFEATIPSFEEFCDFMKDGSFITNVEIKTNNTWYQDIERKAVDMIKSYGLEDRIIFSSFNWISVMRAKKLAPQIECGFLYTGNRHIHLAPEAVEAGIQYMHPDFALLDDETVAECAECNVGLNVWTVNTEERMGQLIRWDREFHAINAVIGNYPDMSLRMLGR
ncbi:MAG: glycerophosphodiester phosphodiesterase [Spirochaetales bacterium]|nr:glycerophosphodiester phosphodiesterase [Spirochaetales bacterium]